MSNQPAARIQIVEMDGGEPVDGPSWITTEDGEHIPLPDMSDYAGVAGEAINECESARARFAPMASSHEGYAVLLEEVDELWEEVRGNKRDMDTYRAAMRAEAIQVAAMAIAFVVEVCDS